MAVAKRGRDREPSKASLREIPEVKFDRARERRNPYAARIVGARAKAKGLTVHAALREAILAWLEAAA